MNSETDSRGLAQATCVQMGDLQRWGSPTCPTGIGPSFFLRSGLPTLFDFGDGAQPSEQGHPSFAVKKSDTLASLRGLRREFTWLSESKHWLGLVSSSHFLLGELSAGGPTVRSPGALCP